jgi:hypothetical protein
MNKYEEKQAARRNRYVARAGAAQARSESASNDAHNAVAGIPAGQPILVGHHSERSHRRDIAKSHKAMDRCLEENKKAEYYAAKAAAVGRGGISADDPDAIKKLEAKLSRLEAERANIKDTNKKARKAAKDGNLQPLKDMGLSDKTIHGLLNPQYGFEKPGYPDYVLKNLGANIRDTKKRIDRLQEEQDREDFGPFGSLDELGWTVFEDRDDNRVCVEFMAKPDAESRGELKGRAFKWSNMNDRWQRQSSANARYAAKQIVSYLQDNNK